MKTRLGHKNCGRHFGKLMVNHHNQENQQLTINQEKPKLEKKKVAVNGRDPVLQYMGEIIEFCSSMGKVAKEEFLNKESQITSEVRKVLIEWIIEVHQRFQFRYETLFLTIKLIDNFEKVNGVRKSDYQLLGLTCLFMAGKYQEIYTPKIKKIVGVCDRLFSMQEILKMEGAVFTSLNFQISDPTVNWYLEFYLFELEQEGIKLTKSFKNQCKHVMELSLLCYEMRYYEAKIQSLGILHGTTMMDKFLHISISSLLRGMGGKQIRKVKDCCKLISQVIEEKESERNEIVNRRY